MDNKNFNLEEKDIYKLFNSVKLEEGEFDSMEKEISTIEKERIKKNLNQKIESEKNLKKTKYSCVAAAAVLVCLLGVGTASPAFAKNIPVLNSIIQTLNNKYGNKGEYAKYSEMINKSVSDKGIKITINEVIADDSKLIIGYTLKSDKKVKDLEVFGLGRFLKINGKSFASGGSSSGKYMDDCTYVGSEEIHTTIPQKDERFNIDLNITEVSDIKGKWSFAFSASKEEICRKSIVFKPNQKLDLPDSTVNIDKVVVSPIDTSILLSGIYKDKKIERRETMDLDHWIAYDDKGVQLISTGSCYGKTNDNEHFTSEVNFVKQKSIPKYLTVVPCKITPSAGGGVSFKDGKEMPINIKTKKPKEISKPIDSPCPIELPQGKMGKLIIKEIKIESNSTTIKFDAEGKAPYFQGEELHIKDDKGEYVKVKDYNMRKDENKPNELTLIFEALDSNKKYTIFTDDFDNVEFREELKFNIQLK